VERAAPAASNQARVGAWVREVLGVAVASNPSERALRAAEEVIELAQAVGLEPETLHLLVDYVYARPAGEAPQEIAGSLVSLYAVAEAIGVQADVEFEVEMARIRQPEVIERVRRRQGEKREILG
jgi:hypothetical protein